MGGERMAGWGGGVGKEKKAVPYWCESGRLRRKGALILWPGIRVGEPKEH